MSEINYTKLSYYRTKVPVSKSEADIKKFLKKFGLQGTRFTEYKNIGVIEFILLKDGREMHFRFKYDLPENEKYIKQVYRCLFHYLKNRFLAIEFGITTIEKEFLQERVLKLPNGGDATIKELLENRIEGLEYSSDLLLPFKDKNGE